MECDNWMLVCRGDVQATLLTLPKKILMHLHHHRADVDVCGILVIALQL